VLLEAAKDIVYLRRLLKELQMCEADPMSLLSDNQSCIKLVDHPILHAYNKHVEIQHHFICERVQAGDLYGDLYVSYIPNQMQQADLFTKPLPAYKHAHICKEIGLKKFPPSQLACKHIN
jgi:hypothetical protein